MYRIFSSCSNTVKEMDKYLIEFYLVVTETESFSEKEK